MKRRNKFDFIYPLMALVTLLFGLFGLFIAFRLGINSQSTNTVTDTEVVLWTRYVFSNLYHIVPK